MLQRLIVIYFNLFLLDPENLTNSLPAKSTKLSFSILMGFQFLRCRLCWGHLFQDDNEGSVRPQAVVIHFCTNRVTGFRTFVH